MKTEPFVETEIYRIIKDEVRTCKTFRDNRVLIGRPGIGKSQALKRLLQEDGDLYLIEMNLEKGSKAKYPFIEIAEALFGYTHYKLWRKSADTIRREIQDHVGHCHGFQGVLAIDDAQNIEPRILNSFSKWYEWGFPVLFVGNETVIHSRRAKSNAFAQISTRIAGDEVRLPDHVPDDLRSVARKWGVGDEAALCYAEDYGMAKTLRELALMLKRAAVLSGEDKRIGLPHLREAASLMGHSRGLFTITPAQEKADGRRQYQSRPNVA